MQDVINSFTVDGREYPIVFNLNVMQAIQEEYETVAEWGRLTDVSDGEPNAKAVIFGIREMINEGLDIRAEETGGEYKPLTLKQVGRLITELGLSGAAQAMNDTVIESTKSTAKNA